MEDFLTAANTAIGVVALALTSAANWIANKLTWWRNLDNKFIKAAVAVGVFVGMCVVLSILTAPFT
jgi:hypothetical protein